MQFYYASFISRKKHTLQAWSYVTINRICISWSIYLKVKTHIYVLHYLNVYFSISKYSTLVFLISLLVQTIDCVFLTQIIVKKKGLNEKYKLK